MQGGYVIPLSGEFHRARDENNDAPAVLFTDFMCQRHAVEPLHLNIEQQHVEAGAFFPREPQRLRAGKALCVYRLPSALPPLVYECIQVFQHGGFVITDCNLQSRNPSFLFTQRPKAFPGIAQFFPLTHYNILWKRAQQTYSAEKPF